MTSRRALGDALDGAGQIIAALTERAEHAEAESERLMRMKEDYRRESEERGLSLDIAEGAVARVRALADTSRRTGKRLSALDVIDALDAVYSCSRWKSISSVAISTTTPAADAAIGTEVVSPHGNRWVKVAANRWRARGTQGGPDTLALYTDADVHGTLLGVERAEATTERVPPAGAKPERVAEGTT